ncbi:MAG: nucleotide exchange factor GrpE [Halorhodospira sp.]
MDTSEREALVTRFREYLEHLPGSTGSQPASEPEERSAQAPDLFTLLAELAALKNEVRLESRQYKSTLEQLSEACAALREQNRQLREDLEQERRRADAAGEETDREVLLEMLELRDRLAAGHTQAQSFRPGLLTRRGRIRKYLTRMTEGMAMNLRHLDEILARRGVQRQETLQHSFDPQTMHAVETTEAPELPEGSVVREVRQGYLRNGRVLRTAEVIVNKKDSRP